MEGEIQPVERTKEEMPNHIESYQEGLRHLLAYGDDPNDLVYFFATSGLPEHYGYKSLFNVNPEKDESEDVRDRRRRRDLKVYVKEAEEGGSDVLLVAPGNIYHGRLVGERQIREFAKALWNYHYNDYSGPRNGRNWAYGVGIAISGLIGKIIGQGLISSFFPVELLFMGMTAGYGFGYKQSQKGRIITQRNNLWVDGKFTTGLPALEKIVGDGLEESSAKEE